MTVFGLLAPSLDVARGTGIARYGVGLGRALPGVLRPGQRMELIAPTGYAGLENAREIGSTRRRLYARWAFTRSPRVERFCPDLDLLHVLTTFVPVPTRKPLVVTVMDLMPLLHPEWSPRREVMLYRQYSRWFTRHADAFIVPSHFVGRGLTEHLGIDPSRISVVGLGAELPPVTEKADEILTGYGLEPGGYLLYLGAVAIRKNITTLLDALGDDGLPLVMVGPDAFGAAEVHAAADKVNPHMLRRLGAVSDEEVSALLRGARALVHPSLDEGFGLTVAEAMGVGTPVLVSAAGSLPEVAGDAGIVVADNTVASWREALRHTEDDTEMARLAAAGQVRAVRWTWVRAAEETQRVYEEVLARS